MPIVEYKCEKCGHEFDEIILSHSAVKDTFECPKCGAVATKKNVPSSHGFNATDLARARQ